MCIMGNPPPPIATQALDKVEEGIVDSTTDTKEPAPRSDTTLWRGLQLCGCIVGLQTSYVTWGVIQVVVTYIVIIDMLYCCPVVLLVCFYTGAHCTVCYVVVVLFDCGHNCEVVQVGIVFGC